MVNLIAQSSITLLGYDSWNDLSVLDMWLRDSLASTHTDLIFFIRDNPPRLFRFSPFQSRPLSKELPSLLSICKCTGSGDATSHKQRKQKIWKVTHTGKHKSLLKNVVVTASCSACQQTWYLKKPDLPGILRKVGGLFAADIPYFLES